MRTDLPSKEYFENYVAYDPATGVFVWRHRPDAPQGWNTRFAGKPAGSVDFFGYTNIRIIVSTYKAHRMAWLFVHGEWPTLEIDHINGDRSDNRIGNLRQATRIQNMQNHKGWAKKTTPKGVTRRDRYGKTVYLAQINPGGKRSVHLGTFQTVEAAAAAYAEASRKYHGEFGRADG
jgi:hypothetical protein